MPESSASRPRRTWQRSVFAGLVVSIYCGCNLFGTTQIADLDSGTENSDAGPIGADGSTAADGGNTGTDASTADMVVVEDFRLEIEESMRQGLVTRVSLFTPGNATRDVSVAAVGALISADAATWSNSLSVTSTGSTTFWLAVPMSASLDDEVALTASFSNRTATFIETVAEPVYAAVVVDGDTRTIELIDTLAAELIDVPPLLLNQPVRSVSAIAVPPAGSTFGDDIYLGINYDEPKLPTIHRYDREAGTLVLFSDGAAAAATDSPDENVTKLRYAPPTSRLGEALLFASSSLMGGDGIFAVDGVGSMTRINSLNNSTDIFLDVDNILGDLGYAEPLYVASNGANITEVPPGVASGQDTNRLVSDLGLQGGSRLSFAHPAGSFAGELWVVQSNLTEDPNTGYVGSFDPQAGAVDNLATDLERPISGTVVGTGPLGDVMWLSLEDAATIDVMRSNGTRYTALRGLDNANDLLFAEDQSLYLLDNDVVWRIRPAGLP